MKIIMPSAGLGTRLRPHTYSKPKPMVSVAGKPVLGHILDKLVQLHPEELVFITGYLGEQIEDYVRSNYSIPSRFVEQKERKGQSHAIYLAKDAIDQPVLIVFVDTIFEADLGRLQDLTTDGAIFVREVEDPSRFGVVQLKNGLITRLVEKPKEYVSNLAVAGIYYIKAWKLFLECLEDQIQHDEPVNGEWFLADALQKMIDRGAKLEPLPLNVWEDAGQKDAVLQCNRYLLAQMGAGQVECRDRSIIIPPVYIGTGVEIVDSVVGPNVSLGEGTRVQRCLLEDCVVGDGSVLENVVMRDSIIGSNAIVRGSFRELNVGDDSEVVSD